MEQIRFNHKFDYKIYTNGIDDKSKALIPPMIIQPFVENSILHGINPKDSKSLLSIDITLVDSEYVITIIDDGIGRAASKAMKKDSSIKKESLGLKITEKRLQLLQQSLEKDLEIIDLYDIEGKAAGTKVLIKLVVS